ncbi:MAG: hypothetical protein Q9217_005932 [Psora testacea]
MLQRDGLRQHRPEPTPVNPHPQYSKSFYDKVLPPIGVHDGHHRTVWPSRQWSAADGTSQSRTKSEAPKSPLRDRSPVEKVAGNSCAQASTLGPILPKQRDASRSPSPDSRGSSNVTYETQATSTDLPALQTRTILEQTDQMEPLSGDIPGSFDLVAPPEEGHQTFSLEARSVQLFSRHHLEIIFSNPSSLLRFTAFLSTHRPRSIPMLIYYLDALKALKAIKYANAIAEALNPISGYTFTAESIQATSNHELADKAGKAFAVLTEQDLPAYITQMYIQVVSLSISRRITGTLAPHLRDASEGLAEVFCLTDPSRPDNPIVFASQEFNRTTQYGLNYVIGRNCRFLQGPKTNPLSPRRLGDAVRAGREHCEVFLNYRRDGSPFMNLLMIAPLCDSRGKIRYFIGAQVDVSGLVKDCTDLESLQRLVLQEQTGNLHVNGEEEEKDDFQDLSEMLNMAELEIVRKHGGRMHREYQDDDSDIARSGAPHMPRLLLQEPSADAGQGSHGKQQSGKLSGIYQNVGPGARDERCCRIDLQQYLLIRPYPSFRILFASPTLRVPGILQSPFMDKIGGSSRVREELSTALAKGRGVTAKIRWVSRVDEGGRNRWIHCTPLVGSNGQIGVWMVVLVDDDEEVNRKWRQAPPVVAPYRGKIYGASQLGGGGSTDSITGKQNNSPILAEPPSRAHYQERQGSHAGSLRSTSPNSVAI